MAWFFLISMIITNVTIIACCRYAYGNYGKVRNHLVLDVTFTEEQLEDKDIWVIVNQFNKNIKKIHIVGFITQFLPFLLLKWMSLFTVSYLVWCFGYLGIVMWYECHKHRELYALKKQKGYVAGENTHIIKIDTRVTADSDSMPVSVFWMLPGILLCFVPFAWRETFQVLTSIWEILTIVVLPLGIKFLYAGMYFFFVKQRNVVYCEDSDINYACNRLTKRDISLTIIVMNGIDAIAFLCLQYSMIKTENLIFGMIPFIILETAASILLISCMFRIQKKRKVLLENQTEEYLVDEDEYWATGFYNNPHDTRWLVPNRSCETNMTFNMAKRGVRIFEWSCLIGVAALLIWMIWIMLPFDFAIPKLSITQQGVEIAFPGSYGQTIAYQEITDISLIQEMPDVRLRKKNGEETHTQRIGLFYGRTIGNCYLYLSEENSPILRIDTEEKVYFYNYDTEQTLQTYYEQIRQHM